MGTEVTFTCETEGASIYYRTDGAEPDLNDKNGLELYTGPLEINRAPYADLLRVPGIGVKSARRILSARRSTKLTFQDLKKLGVVMKRAVYFITCGGRMMYPTKLEEDYIVRNLTDPKERIRFGSDGMSYRQMTLFDDGMFPNGVRHEEKRII